MSKTVKLKHCFQTSGKRIEYFYDGMAFASDGILEIPVDREPWIKRAWITGYWFSPSGERLWDWTQVLQEIERQNPADTAKSGKEKAR